MMPLQERFAAGLFQEPGVYNKPMPLGVIGTAEIITLDPVAGAEWIYTADYDMLVLSFVANLTTSAAVANRVVAVVADDGTNIFMQIGSSANQTATLTYTYCGYAGSISSGGVAGGRLTIGFPATGIKLRKGDRIRSLTNLIDVGDNWGVANLQVEHY